MTRIQHLWHRWLALNEQAESLDRAGCHTTATHKEEYNVGAHLSSETATCLQDVLFQLRHAELVEDWPAVARATDDIARLSSCKPVPNPWDKPALAA